MSKGNASCNLRFRTVVRSVQRVIFAVAIILTPFFGQAATLPNGFVETLYSEVWGGVGMAFSPEGKLFVCTKNGTLYNFRPGGAYLSTFMTLDVETSGEHGLLGITFDPNYGANHFIYVFYTAKTPTIHNRVSRFTARWDGNLVVDGSEVILLEMDTLSDATWHNGGALHFGPDGKLYISAGENNVPANAQSLNNVLGKILRINPDGTIPPDNPFYNQTSANNRAIWAMGLRNPYTFAFQPVTGRMFINDVGGGNWEEINEGFAGANYGWPATEGYTTNPLYRTPLHAYSHAGNGTSGAAIVGGAFYNLQTPSFPSQYVGKYFFMDYTTSWVRTLDPATGIVAPFATGLQNLPKYLIFGPDGALYYISGNASPQGVYRIQFSSNLMPQIVTHPASQTVSVGATATFSVIASGDQSFTYQWQKNGADIAGATADTFTTPATGIADNGSLFLCRVTNNYGTVNSGVATLTVTANQPPVALISDPQIGALYSAGETISYVGSGTDPEDGNLPASAYLWEIHFLHDDHSHPAFGPATGFTSGSYTIPVTGETATDVGYRIYLTVFDSQGLYRTYYRTLRPRISTITLTSVPQGLQVALGTTNQASPLAVDGVVGMTRNISAPSPQTLNGITYVWDSWSDGGAVAHDISTPQSNTTYTAAFRVASAGIVQQPSDAVVDEGGVATFAVAASGDALSYRWQKDGVDIVGADSATYGTPPTSRADNGAIFVCVVTNMYGSLSSVGARLTVNDRTPPVITLSGANPMSIEGGAVFNDPGATALDAWDGVRPVSVSGAVVNTVVGGYTITYSASDTNGNTATKERVVNVVDTTAPVITLNGGNPVSIQRGSTFNDPGATAIDVCDGGRPVTVTGSVNTWVVGTYVIYYSASDTRGNAGTASRTVNVIDTLAPTISGILVSNIGSTAAVITWNTDEPSDSQVNYGVSNALGLSSPVAAQLVKVHSVSLTGLRRNTTYYYRVRSKDATGNAAVSSVLSFRTAK